MTWSRFDDGAAKHPKARLAGNEAWSLWSAAVQYCNRYLTDGVVPLAALAVDCLPEPISMVKAKKLADRLVEAKVRDDGHGLFEALGPNKFAVHDFLDWNPSKEQVEAKRKADRDRKRGGPESGGQSGAPPPRIPRGTPEGTREESKQDSTSREGARVPAQPAVPSPAQPSESSARAHEVHEPPEAEPRLTICPLDLREKAESVGILGDFVDKYQAEPEQIREVIREFVSYWSIGGGQGRKQANWLRKLREHLRRACEKPGGLKPIGELEHEQHGGGGPSREVRIAKAEGAAAMALMREAHATGGK